ncbi:MAG TPA: hypothetical protein VGG18_16490 [Granulicella sp.]
MATAPATDDAWTRGIPTDPADPKNAAWNQYDATIRDAVRTYDRHLQGQGGYFPNVTLNWLLVKAMCWTETGPGSQEWATKPAQIGVIKGNVTDPGLADLLSGKPKSQLILPPEYAPGGPLQITLANTRQIPEFNVRAGIGYLLLKAAITSKLSVLPPEVPFSHYTAVARDNFSVIGGKVHTTVDELLRDNPNPGKPSQPRPIFPGNDVLYKPAAEHITGWKTIDAAFAASSYNIKNVALYTTRIAYCLSILQRSGR